MDYGQVFDLRAPDKNFPQLQSRHVVGHVAE